jgi:nucleoside-diphosphate-sugar epimerase
MHSQSRELRRAWIFGCGYLGSPLLTRWLTAGVAVTVMTRSTEKAARLRGLGAQAVVAEGGGYTLPSTAPDVIAWAVGFGRAERQHGTREEAWVGGLQRLTHDLAQRGWSPRLVYVSTTGVYGDAAGAELDESVATAPHTEGGRAALAAEAVVRGFSADAVALRLAGIIGPGRLLQSATEIQRGMVVRSPADSWLNLVHVEDAARLIDVVARHERPPAIINAAMDRTPTRREYYEGLARRLDAPRPRFEPTTVGTNRRIVSRVRQGLLPFRYEAIEAALDSMVESGS